MPFQAPQPPAAGFALHGRVVPDAELAAVDPEDWPLERYRPELLDRRGAIVSYISALIDERGAENVLVFP